MLLREIVARLNSGEHTTLLGKPWNLFQVPRVLKRAEETIMSAIRLNPVAVYGIPCCLRIEALRRVVGRVLHQIKQRFPKDFARLYSRVRMIRPMPKRKTVDGTLGEWLGTKFEQTYSHCDPLRLRREIRVQWDEWDWGIVELAEAGQTEAQFAATAAHEFGHACSMTADIERRNAPSDEWGAEATSEWYAYKWGFGKLCAVARKNRDFGHHGAGPGETVEIYDQTFKLSRNFVYREI